MELRIVTWNLMHGRAVPPAGRDLLEEFGAALSGWTWNVAMLQEVPPWWPGALAARTGSTCRFSLTSRNALLPLRRYIARRWPDAIRSNGGGCNAILVRRPLTIVDHRHQRVRLLPERRWVHAVRLQDGLWLANVHTGGSSSEARRAAQAAMTWSQSEPAVLGGDFNIHGLLLDDWKHVAGQGPDHVFVRSLDRVGDAAALAHEPLSDHAPVAVTVREVPALRAPETSH